ncbi:Tetratricopeptide repeat-like superfamily protein [Heracleum sosnowskyi]|uniref:Tetratricopeptide repeat-like superfamily protein n=1 Tax=Heracleum sosnowskyi TaxID=360622 RepID=A0AAD8I4W1_9APIA|nr:Tetratricopeptide repeat-like superfamily protein [Heracleum sosnowskyi]
MNLYLQIDKPNKALSIFSDLVSSLKPDGFSAVAALTACGRNQDLRNGRVVHGMVIRFELCDEPILCNALIDMYSRNGNVLRAKTVFDVMGVRDVVSWTSLLNGFVKCDDMVSARKVFDEMPVRNVVSWTGMIVGFVRGKVSVNGLELFREMVGDGVFPTEITVVAVLSGCADIGALDFGRSVHGFVSKSVLVRDMAVNNALIDMYSKSGSLESGLEIFYGMGCKDLFTWTTTISGLALHGKGRPAVELFDNMLASGLTPNMVTYVAVLSACGHSGLIEEGKLLFKNMIHINGFKPTIHHYGCMVDLLGRAGCVQEAIEFIECMPMRPDAVIWRSLLSACLGKGDLKLAEMAAKKVIELEPDNDGVYILLWNFYRNANQWDDASKTIKMMRSQRIKKQPGCSWIELNGIVHEFLAEDSMSYIRPDMYIVLETVINELKHDIDDLLFE